MDNSFYSNLLEIAKHHADVQHALRKKLAASKLEAAIYNSTNANNAAGTAATIANPFWRASRRSPAP